jgi:hypothetical protein
MADLVIVARFGAAEFEPVERALARQGRTIAASSREFANHRRQHRIMAKLIVIVEIFVAKGDAEYALANQRSNFMLDEIRSALILETGGKTIDQANRPIGYAQQQSTGIARHRIAIESRHHIATFYACKCVALRATLRLHRGTPLLSVRLCRRRTFSRLVPRCTLYL